MANETAPPSTEPAGEFSLRVEQVEGFTFNVRFDKEHYPTLQMSEPAPLGDDAAPNPARVLAAAIGDCLSASLLFCMKRRGAPLDGVSADVTSRSCATNASGSASARCASRCTPRSRAERRRSRPASRPSRTSAW